MSNGVCYLFCGLPAAERLVVSLWSLRRFHDWPVTIFASPECMRVAEVIRGHFLGVAPIVPIESPLGIRHGHYLLKPLLASRTPYDRTLFLDADTLVVGPLDDLWTYREPIILTSYGEWVTTGRRVSGRCRWFAGRSPAVDKLIERATTTTYPCLNTGVFLFDRGIPEIDLWHSLTEVGLGLEAGVPTHRPSHMTDEIAMQLLIAVLPQFDKTADGCASLRWRVIGDRWNCSPMHGAEQDEARIWHCHGQKHLRKPEGRRLWEPAFREAYSANAGGLQEWAGRYDKYGVRELVKELKCTPTV